jgi:hypothetical protein
MSDLISRRDAELDKAERTWAELLAFVDSLSPFERDEVRNPDGWSAKDHIAHIAAWKRSFVLWIDDISGHGVLGVSEELFNAGDLDRINAGILEVFRDRPWDEVRIEAIAAHRAKIDAVLAQSGSRLLEPMGKVSLIEALPDLTWEHDRDHLNWLKQPLTEGVAR